MSSKPITMSSHTGEGIERTDVTPGQYEHFLARLKSAQVIEGHDHRGDRWQLWLPLSITLIYALAGSIWITASDVALRYIAGNVEIYQTLQTSKGWLFIGVTAVILYITLSSIAHHLRTSRRSLEEGRMRLDLALAAAQGGVWDRDLSTGKIYLSRHLRYLLGIKKSVLTAEEWCDIIHPEDVEPTREATKFMYSHPDTEQRFEYRVQTADGEYRRVHVMGRMWQDSLGQPARMLGVAIDVTDWRTAEERVDHLSHFDALTGLPNRRLLHRKLTQLVNDVEIDSGPILVTIVNLAQFLEVNNEIGQGGGDKVLVEVANRLQMFSGPSGMSARLGADQFALVLPVQSHTPKDIGKTAERLCRLFTKPMKIGGQKLELSVNMGLAVYPVDGKTADTLLANADIALGQARKSKDRRICFFETGMNEEFRERTNLTRDLREAARKEELRVNYQPVIRTSDGRICGFEALARWDHPKLGPVSPSIFIPLAEEAGLIGMISNFMLRKACIQAARWNNAMGDTLLISVNLSAMDLASDTLDQDIHKILQDTDLSPTCLELEITESALMNNMEKAAETLSRLREMGISIAIDDFGTGYSSLVALRRLPVSRLKIDRGFISGYGTDSESTAIVDSILRFAHSLGLNVTAEGVEHQRQLERLAEQQCEKVQGFLFGKPMFADEAEHAINSGSGDVISIKDAPVRDEASVRLADKPLT